jgi:hypothetical protein
MEKNFYSNIEHEAIVVIQKVNKTTSHTWLFTKMNNGIWLFLEIICYLLLIGLVLFALFLPSGEIYGSQEISESVTVDTRVNVKEIVEFFVILKGMIVVLGLLMIVPAILFRKLRKKNNLLEELNNVSSKFLEKHKLK